MLKEANKNLEKEGIIVVNRVQGKNGFYTLKRDWVKHDFVKKELLE